MRQPTKRCGPKQKSLNVSKATSQPHSKPPQGSNAIWLPYFEIYAMWMLSGCYLAHTQSHIAFTLTTREGLCYLASIIRAAAHKIIAQGRQKQRQQQRLRELFHSEVGERTPDNRWKGSKATCDPVLPGYPVVGSNWFTRLSGGFDPVEPVVWSARPGSQEEPHENEP
jgi:hypothetical protein